MKINAFIINLETYSNRRKRILEKINEFDSITPVIVKAISGSELSKEQIDNVYIAPNNFFQRLSRIELSKNEIACALSHVKCAQEVLNNKLKYALVLEDDVLFSRNFNSSVLEAVKFLEKINQPSIVLFSARTIIAKKPESVANGFSFHKCIDGIGAYGYLINASAAELIVRKFIPFTCPFDHWFYHACNGIRIFSLQPHQLSFIGDNDDSSLRLQRNANSEKWHNWIYSLPFFCRMLLRFTYRSLKVKFWKILNRGRYVKKEW